MTCHDIGIQSGNKSVKSTLTGQNTGIGITFVSNCKYFKVLYSQNRLTDGETSFTTNFLRYCSYR
jgi:hypothetical protein